MSRSGNADTGRGLEGGTRREARRLVSRAGPRPHRFKFPTCRPLHGASAAHMLSKARAPVSTTTPRGDATTHLYEGGLPQDQRHVDMAHVGGSQAAGDGGESAGAAVLGEGQRGASVPATLREMGGDSCPWQRISAHTDPLPGQALGVEGGVVGGEEHLSGFPTLPASCHA